MGELSYKLGDLQNLRQGNAFIEVTRIFNTALMRLILTLARLNIFQLAMGLPKKPNARFKFVSIYQLLVHNKHKFHK